MISKRRLFNVILLYYFPLHCVKCTRRRKVLWVDGLMISGKYQRKDDCTRRKTAFWIDDWFFFGDDQIDGCWNLCLKLVEFRQGPGEMFNIHSDSFYVYSNTLSLLFMYFMTFLMARHYTVSDHMDWPNLQ